LNPVIKARSTSVLIFHLTINNPGEQMI